VVLAGQCVICIPLKEVSGSCHLAKACETPKAAEPRALQRRGSWIWVLFFYLLIIMSPFSWSMNHLMAQIRLWKHCILGRADFAAALAYTFNPNCGLSQQPHHPCHSIYVGDQKQLQISKPVAQLCVQKLYGI